MKNYQIFIVAFICFALVLFITFAVYFPKPSGPPFAVVEPSDQRIVAEEGKDLIIAKYKILNAGGNDLVLGEASSSCGCSVASISPKVIPPGKQAVATVEGHPPGVGERPVNFLIQSNSSPNSVIAFVLTMVGSRKTPFVAYNSGPVRFGDLTSQTQEEHVLVETRERQVDSPWINCAICTNKFFAVNGGLKEERSAGGGVVSRRYEYTVSALQLPGVGEYQASVLFQSENPQETVFHLPLQASVRPPVYSAPSSIYASFVRGEAQSARMNLIVISTDDVPNFEADPIIDESFPLEIRRLKSESKRVFFEIFPLKPLQASIATSLSFRTNSPLSPIFKVPIKFVVNDP